MRKERKILSLSCQTTYPAKKEQMAGEGGGLIITRTITKGLLRGPYRSYVCMLYFSDNGGNSKTKVLDRG